MSSISFGKNRESNMIKNDDMISASATFQRKRNNYDRKTLTMTSIDSNL